jgi:hypothetical protein
MTDDRKHTSYLTDRLTMHADNKTKRAMQIDCEQAATEIERLINALREIAGMDPNTDSEEGYNEWGEADCFRRVREIAEKALDNRPRALAQPNDGQPLQGGFNNAELRAAWDKKLPGQEPKGQELSAFAIGSEVGFAHARDLEMQDWNRLHHVCKKHGIHPGRTDDSLIDVIDHALEPPQADTARLDWIARQNLDELSMHLVIDAEHDGEYYVCGDSNKPRYGVTLRAAIDAAMET